MATVALTGASGFVGRHVLAHLLQQGHSVRALARHPGQLPSAENLVSVFGSLEAAAALSGLVERCDAVIHLAGATAGRDYAELARTNAAGTRRLIEAVRQTRPSARLIHVSSLAARHPELSDYAASKRAGEELVSGSRLNWIILRPPAVYGPDDPALAPLWRALARGWLPRTGPAEARFSLLHVADLASALERLAASPEAASRQTLCLHDGQAGGYGWADLIALAEAARGRPVRSLPIPRGLLWLAAHVNLALARLRGRRPPPLVPGKLRELAHHDWVCDNTDLPGCPDWAPSLTLETALLGLPGWSRQA